MSNVLSAAEYLDEMHEILKLKGENVFKVRAFEKGADAIRAYVEQGGDLVSLAKAGKLTELESIGKGIAEVLSQFLLEGKTQARDELKTTLPLGLFELSKVPGLGPKKALILINDLQISSLAELEYACLENRLLKLKGFGEKLQVKIFESVRFIQSNAGFIRIDEALVRAARVSAFIEIEILSTLEKGSIYSEAGALRRKCETLSVLEFLIGVGANATSDFSTAYVEELREKWNVILTEKEGFPVKIHFSSLESFGGTLVRLTGSEQHLRALETITVTATASSTEEIYYERRSLPWIAPELRETGEEIEFARSGHLTELPRENSIQGVFHFHTTASDGSASLEEMVKAAKTAGFKYIGVSDHSQSAFYARGLKSDIVLEQEKEVRRVQEKYPDIRIFWGIESDILADGSLDYDANVLKRFDFVIASIHSRFEMDRTTMTERVLEAVRNPATRFLGHATGRLLLGRKGYDMDLEKIINECASHDVAIEINANPARLDIDWRWGPQLRKAGTWVSVNPDAHSTEGFADTHYGLTVARKALLSCSQVINTKSVNEVEKWLSRSL